MDIHEAPGRRYHYKDPRTVQIRDGQIIYTRSHISTDSGRETGVTARSRSEAVDEATQTYRCAKACVVCGMCGTDKDAGGRPGPGPTRVRISEWKQTRALNAKLR